MPARKMTKKAAATSAGKPPKPEYAVRHFAHAAAWRDWLNLHHANEPGVWLRFAKKAGALVSVSYSDALDVALCFGWIDGQVKRYDDDSWIQKFTPRGAKSLWSKVNVGRVDALERADLMQPSGCASVDAARADGRWARAYDPASTAAVPEDLERALDANRGAREFFATLSKANRYAVIFRVQTATTDAARARRIGDLVAMLARGEAIHS